MTTVSSTLDQPNRAGDVLGTVAAHGSTNVPVVPVGQRAADVLAALQGRSYDTTALVAVCAVTSCEGW